jgi:hypothetical protein
VVNSCSNLVAQAANFKLIQGHIPYGTHFNLGLKSARYFFFMRNPVDRHFSDVAHGVRHSDHGFHSLLSTMAADPVALATVGDTVIYYRNTATHYFSGTFFTREAALPEFHRAAQTVLESEFVGIAERFDESVLILARKLGWSHFVYEKRNVAAHPLTKIIGAETRKHCESRLSYDMALYRIACERFDREARSHGAHLQEAAHQLQEIVSLQSKAFPGLENHTYLVGDPVLTQQMPGATWKPDSPLGLWFNPLESNRSSLPQPEPAFA